MNTAASIFYYTSRFTLVAVIETVALFFLRLYRSSLSDEKYVSNEITNIELKMGALLTAIKSNNDSAIEEILLILSKTERNFILKKGEISIYHSSDGEDMLPASIVGHIMEKIALFSRK